MGTLAYLNRATTANGVLFSYAMGAGETAFATATLHLVNTRSGAAITNAILVGTNWVANVPTGRYIAWVDEYDAVPAMIRHSDPILFSITATDVDGEALDFSWSGDERDWVTLGLDDQALRRSIFVNESCHRLHWKLESRQQNARTVLRSVNYHLRQRGRSESAEER